MIIRVVVAPNPLRCPETTLVCQPPLAGLVCNSGFDVDLTRPDMNFPSF